MSSPSVDELAAALLLAMPAVYGGDEKWAFRDAQSILRRLPSQTDQVVQWAATQEPTGDWACAECRPTSDMIEPGFRCAPHEARFRRARPLVMAATNVRAALR